MKTQLVVFACSCFLLISSCSRNNDNYDDMGDGTWRVTLFTDSGNDETSDFSGYSFVFSDGNVVMAIKNGNSVTGTWSQSSSEFTIDLGPKTDNNKPLGELTDNWEIISVSSSEIKLQDDNPASAEFLTFKKN